MSVAVAEAKSDIYEREDLLNGCQAVAHGVRLADVDVIAAYPIRPYTEVMDALSKLIVEKNPADVAALSATALEGGKTVEEVRTELIGRIGENMSIRRFKRFETSGKLASYLHGTRIGVMVEFEGADEQVGKDVAMHIAAMKPVSLAASDVPAELIAKERSVAELKAAESNKPADIVTKMVEGSVQKYLKEVSLLNQSFVKNDKQTVEQMLKEAKSAVKSFAMFIVGEGIEKKQDDFAAEVAAQVAAAKQA